MADARVDVGEGTYTTIRVQRARSGVVAAQPWTDDDALTSLFADETEPVTQEPVGGHDYEDDAEVLDAIAVVATAATGSEHINSLSALERQMSIYPILTDANAQFDFLATYHAGAHAQAQLDANERLTEDDRVRLRLAVSAGEHAKSALIGSMFKLVVQIAREQATRRYGRQRGLLMLEDLVQEANAALTKALATYNRKNCPTWSLYAGKTIRDTIRNKISETTELSHINVPSSWWRLQRVAVPIHAELAEQFGRDPTLEEMQAALSARGMEWAREHLTDKQKLLPEDEQDALCQAKLVKQGMDRAIKEYDKIRQLTGPTTSLNAALSDDGERTRADMLTDEDPGHLFDDVERAEARRDLMNALSSFDARERQIIMYRFGFVDDGDWHYTKLAPLFGVSPERIRQIEQKVLAKLASADFTHLASHLAPAGENDPGASSDTGTTATTRPYRPEQPRGP